MTTIPSVDTGACYIISVRDELQIYSGFTTVNPTLVNKSLALGYQTEIHIGHFKTQTKSQANTEFIEKNLPLVITVNLFIRMSFFICSLLTKISTFFHRPMTDL